MNDKKAVEEADANLTRVRKEEAQKTADAKAAYEKAQSNLNNLRTSVRSFYFSICNFHHNKATGNILIPTRYVLTTFPIQLLKLL